MSVADIHGVLIMCDKQQWSDWQESMHNSVKGRAGRRAEKPWTKGGDGSIPQ